MPPRRLPPDFIGHLYYFLGPAIRTNVLDALIKSVGSHPRGGAGGEVGVLSVPVSSG